jgi:hypothetical protein
MESAAPGSGSRPGAGVAVVFGGLAAKRALFGKKRGRRPVDLVRGVIEDGTDVIENARTLPTARTAPSAVVLRIRFAGPARFRALAGDSTTMVWRRAGARSPSFASSGNVAASGRGYYIASAANEVRGDPGDHHRARMASIMKRPVLRAARRQGSALLGEETVRRAGRFKDTVHPLRQS